MKKKIIVLLVLVFMFVLAGCEKDDKVTTHTTEPKITEPADTNETTEENTTETEEKTTEETTEVEEETIEETTEETTEEDSEEDVTEPEEKVIVLDEELREKGKSYSLKVDTTNFNTFTLELFMKGSYDNPVTIKKFAIDGEELDLKHPELPTKASEETTGEFIFGDYTLKLKRATYYQGLRLKSKPNGENGKLILDTTTINEIELELVFTTNAANWFEKVEIRLSK